MQEAGLHGTSDMGRLRWERTRSEATALRATTHPLPGGPNIVEVGRGGGGRRRPAQGHKEHERGRRHGRHPLGLVVLEESEREPAACEQATGRVGHRPDSSALIGRLRQQAPKQEACGTENLESCSPSARCPVVMVPICPRAQRVHPLPVLSTLSYAKREHAGGGGGAHGGWRWCARWVRMAALGAPCPCGCVTPQPE